MTNEIRPRGKSNMNEMFRQVMAEKGIEPCPLCGVPGKWEIFHTPEHPCQKQPAPQEEPAPP